MDIPVAYHLLQWHVSKRGVYWYLVPGIDLMSTIATCHTLRRDTHPSGIRPPGHTPPWKHTPFRNPLSSLHPHSPQHPSCEQNERQTGEQMSTFPKATFAGGNNFSRTKFSSKMSHLVALTPCMFTEIT